MNSLENNTLELSVTEAVKELEKAIEREGIDPRKGLPEELFLLASTLMPTVNIDLFVVNQKREVLFSWREENHHGKGWHIPGGCVRLQELLETRVQKTALKELGTEVLFSPDPICVRQSVLDWERPIENQLQRSHGISFLFLCQLPDGYELPERCVGTELRWFDHMPEDILFVHKRLYEDIFSDWFNGILKVPDVNKYQELGEGKAK